MTRKVLFHLAHKRVTSPLSSRHPQITVVTQPASFVTSVLSSDFTETLTFVDHYCASDRVAREGSI